MGKHHSICRVQFCWADSLIEDDKFLRYCGKHLPQYVEALGKRLRELNTVARKRPKLRRVQPVEGPSQPDGVMMLSSARERSGWGVVRLTNPGDKQRPIHYFRAGQPFAMCGGHFIHNKPVGPSFFRQCTNCLSVMRSAGKPALRGAPPVVDVKKHQELLEYARWRSENLKRKVDAKKKPPKLMCLCGHGENHHRPSFKDVVGRGACRDCGQCFCFTQVEQLCVCGHDKSTHHHHLRIPYACKAAAVSPCSCRKFLAMPA